METTMWARPLGMMHIRYPNKAWPLFSNFFPYSRKKYRKQRQFCRRSLVLVTPHRIQFSGQNPCPTMVKHSCYSSLEIPHILLIVNNFLTSMYIPDETHFSDISKLAYTNEKKNKLYLLGFGNLNHNDSF